LTVEPLLGYTLIEGIVKIPSLTFCSCPSMGTMTTSSEVVSFIRTQEENLRVFFGRFLIVHLTPHSDMDDYLGFIPPES
jgi:hypothetical protein